MMSEKDLKDSNRLFNLDYLRGGAAFSIMIYHYFSLGFYVPESETFLGRIGVYGVSIFYILSGLTLYYVYHNKMKSMKDVKSFFIKRFFRIFPLLWLVTIVSIILFKETLDYSKLFLNFSGLFGFFQWDEYYAVGAWSIGNELVFYMFFPLFIYLMRKGKIYLFGFSLIIFCIYLYFTFFLLDNTKPISVQWRDYVNPLNQIFLFLGGYLMGFVFTNKTINQAYIILMLIGGMGIFILYPIEGDKINLVTGVNRIIITFSCFLICLGFFKLNIKTPSFLHFGLSTLGEASYSVYLLHPIVYGVVSIFSKYFYHLEVYAIIFISVILSLISSYFVYQYFEKYFMKLGRKF